MISEKESVQWFSLTGMSSNPVEFLFPCSLIFSMCQLSFACAVSKLSGLFVVILGRIIINVGFFHTNLFGHCNCANQINEKPENGCLSIYFYFWGALKFFSLPVGISRPKAVLVLSIKSVLLVWSELFFLEIRLAENRQRFHS